MRCYLEAVEHSRTTRWSQIQAFGCGTKTYNGAIAVDHDGQPVGSILEAAKADGFKTGLVVTDKINSATPACYAAHVASRRSKDRIAEQIIGYSHPLGPQVDLLLGGGRCSFKPKSDPTSCRKDNIDLYGYAKSKGYGVAVNRTAFDDFNKNKSKVLNLPHIGLFNDHTMMYEIDRRRQPEKEPSLLEMVDTALTSLNRATHSSDRGYFLMIEASRIDHAGHENVPVGQLHEVLMYNNVMKHVREWIDNHPDTIMLSAADHECGGLTLIKRFNPHPLKYANMTSHYAANLRINYDGTDLRSYVTDTVFPGYGLAILSAEATDKFFASSFPTFAPLLSKKIGIEWSTHGHTAIDVTLYGYGANSTGTVSRHDRQATGTTLICQGTLRVF
ncbi:alkaline phosphatase-like protein [Ophiobolus disseminans]|uniref:alkaline phosphatase n=1 Tax=Ophiobolus disseminans TaxID=1469910 RepID=A0A6A7AE89_9PLEO|nr:alkaline phosphatase-like protein [Ophiobolus disseminans]